MIDILNAFFSSRSSRDRCNMVTSRTQKAAQLPEGAKEIPIGQFRPPVGGGQLGLFDHFRQIVHGSGAAFKFLDGEELHLAAGYRRTPAAVRWPDKAGYEAVAPHPIRLQPVVYQAGKFILAQVVLLDKREHS
jgi:hypothetical protein